MKLLKMTQNEKGMSPGLAHHETTTLNNVFADYKNKTSDEVVEILDGFLAEVEKFSERFDAFHNGVRDSKYSSHIGRRVYHVRVLLAEVHHQIATASDELEEGWVFA